MREGGAVVEAVIVSLEEFADLCGVTPETMRVHLKTVEGEPDWLIAKGDRGRAYQIEAHGGVAWWKARRDAEDNASTERRNQLAQMRFDLLGPAVIDQAQLSMSGRARKEEFEAGFKELEFRKAMGELVEKAELLHTLTGAAVELRRRLMLCPGEFAIVAGFEADQVKPLEGILARALDAFVTSLAPIGIVAASDAEASQ